MVRYPMADFQERVRRDIKDIYGIDLDAPAASTPVRRGAGAHSGGIVCVGLRRWCA